MEINEALFNLIHTVRHRMTEKIKALGLDLSPMHLKSLKIISMIEECTGQKLTEFMGRDKAQINRLIKALVQEELVIKTENEHDGRSYVLSLSSRGEDVIKLFNDIESKVFTNMVRDVPPEEIEHFVQLASQFKNNLQ